jgi:hypothetical protein
MAAQSQFSPPSMASPAPASVPYAPRWAAPQAWPSPTW